MIAHVQAVNTRPSLSYHAAWVRGYYEVCTGMCQLALPNVQVVLFSESMLELVSAVYRCRQRAQPTVSPALSLP